MSSVVKEAVRRPTCEDCHGSGSIGPAPCPTCLSRIPLPVRVASDVPTEPAPPPRSSAPTAPAAPERSYAAEQYAINEALHRDNGKAVREALDGGVAINVHMSAHAPEDIAERVRKHLASGGSPLRIIGDGGRPRPAFFEATPVPAPPRVAPVVEAPQGGGADVSLWLRRVGSTATALGALALAGDLYGVGAPGVLRYVAVALVGYASLCLVVDLAVTKVVERRAP